MLKKLQIHNAQVCFTFILSSLFRFTIIPQKPKPSCQPSPWGAVKLLNPVQVLKGHIALGNARFPNGTNGHSLDILARVPLWKDGLDYRHGTGHGIGSYLNVHEGPHLISFRPRNVPLEDTMTVTDEPGYYEDGNFGIRLENVLIIKKADTKFNFGDKGYLQFEHITWAPYQRKLIDVGLLTPEELEWLNTYHANCRSILDSYLDESEKAWLKKATEPISV